jgi:SNF2 family DNA or RNA helicase
MTQSFEQKLIAASSAEIFKSAKSLLKNKCLICAYRDDNNDMNAVFEQKKHYDYVTVSSGEHNQSSCSCAQNTGKLCPHAIATVMYFARFNAPAPKPVKEENAKFAGLKYQNFEELAGVENFKPQAQVVIDIESAFPHVPSKWENAVLSVKLKTDKKEYIGNLNNMRQLYFDKTLAVSLKYEYFSLKDHQIIRFLAVNAEGEGSKLLLNSEQTAEFFHCLIGFKNFFRQNRRLIIHPEPAEPVLLERNTKEGKLYFPGICVNEALLPMKKAKVITGRAGCWIGTRGEYWWIPATVDIGWLRNFFRLNEQNAESKKMREILQNDIFPLRIVNGNQAKIGVRFAQIVLDGEIDTDDIFKLNLSYLYDGKLVPADSGRLSSSSGQFWTREENLEKSVDEDLRRLGFVGENSVRKLENPESIGVFLGKVLPVWIKTRDLLISNRLASLCSNNKVLPEINIKCQVQNKLEDKYIISYDIKTDGENLSWSPIVKTIKDGRHYYLSAKGRIISLNKNLRNFLLAADNLIQKVNYQESTFELPIYSVNFWKYIARHFPEAIPKEFAASMLEQARVNEKIQETTELFRGELRQYQAEGVNWMRSMTDKGFNVVLADEMGLGKTVQTLALLASRQKRGDSTALIICPASLIENWKRECEKFVPSFKVIALSGTKRNIHWTNASDYDLMICSYAVARRDALDIKKITVSYLILDEAQHIKNPETINAQSCKNIKAEHRLVLTGTPLENSPDDLWSIFDFLHPGMLGSFNSFKKYYHGIGAAEGLQNDLTQRVSPFIKRRTKKVVCKELPPKIEQTLYCEMQPKQRSIYNKILTESKNQIKKLIKDGKKKANFEILTTLMRLRQICCHPSLLPDHQAEDTEACKMELLKELVLENIDSNQKMLIFSQFTSLLKLIRKWLDEESISYEYLDGATKNRQERVDKFNNSKNIPVFLLSLKAGGTGLNLTSANTVIIYDPWWNPAVEAQAADRTHRIGQTQNVNSLKLVVKDSIEEKILSLQAEKQKIFDNLIENPAAGVNKLTIEELKALI